MTMAVAVALPLTGWATELRSQQELQQLQQTIGRLQQQLASGQDQQQQLIAELEDIERDIVALQQRERAYVQELAQLKTQQQKLNAALQTLSAQAETTQTQLRQIARTSYLLSQQDGLQLLLNNRHPALTAKTLAMYRYIVAAHHRQLTALRRVHENLQHTRQQLQDRQLAIDSTLQQLATTRQQLAASEQSRHQQLQRARINSTADTAKLTQYRAQEAELTALSALSALSASWQRSPHAPAPSTQPADAAIARAAQQVSFSQNRGRMPLPVAATILHRFGQQQADSGLLWEGLLFAVTTEQPVMAIHAGQVIFADWFRRYGQLLILDHGDGYMSLYGHNQRLDVRLGSWVETGQAIALSGNTGGLTQPALYFEIRHNGQPADPLHWCRL